jgi:hypothetical protein
VQSVIDVDGLKRRQIGLVGAHQIEQYGRIQTPAEGDPAAWDGRPGPPSRAKRRTQRLDGHDASAFLVRPVTHQPFLPTPDEGIPIQGLQFIEAVEEKRFQALGHECGIAVRAAERLFDDRVDQAQFAQPSGEITE